MTAESRCGILRYKYIYSLCNKYITWYKILFQALQQKSVSTSSMAPVKFKLQKKKNLFLAPNSNLGENKALCCERVLSFGAN